MQKFSRWYRIQLKIYRRALEHLCTCSKFSVFVQTSLYLFWLWKNREQKSTVFVPLFSRYDQVKTHYFLSPLQFHCCDFFSSLVTNLIAWVQSNDLACGVFDRGSVFPIILEILWLTPCQDIYKSMFGTSSKRNGI